ncbi:dephospho-CoA kinase [Sphingomonas morindae]|uniref:Dephospho-CoA kinase n=1 Tax=Sphingomonas morindae TaxID=1541170 RepID=A0ABY4XC56_9SPHN|nr:dephospho-CoA kinase [Sphingomonas morindae]USI74240.1 dephospho-CoA kinase [Sphingomonas morindae]
MILLGLTGSIGMGKTTVATMFRRMGVPVFDADATVRSLQGPGGALLPAIEAAFPGTTGPDGVDRAALGARVFGDRAALRRLEAIVHPAVDRARRGFVRRHRARPLLVDDVPLLFETGGDRRVDAVLVVSAPAWRQRRRVLARPGMSALRLRQVLARQIPDPIKRRRADFVVDSGADLATTRAAVRRLVACLTAHGVRYCRTCAKSSSIPKPPA